VLQRFFSTVLIWALVGLLVYFFGGQGTVWLLAVLTIATQYEFYSLLEKIGRKPFKTFGTILGATMILAPYYTALWTEGPGLILQTGIIAVMIVACCLRILSEREGDERIEALGSTLFGLIYIPFMLSYLVRILLLPATGTEGPVSADQDIEGVMLIIWMIVATKFTDVGALLVGKAFGKTPMSPSTSPKKTWEGAIGGCLISTGLCFALATLARDAFPDFLTPFWATLFALPIAITSIISDLVESMFKRSAEQKDSGSFIPGIGGAFDLTDSLILAAPTGYFLFGLIM